MGIVILKNLEDATLWYLVTQQYNRFPEYISQGLTWLSFALTFHRVRTSLLSQATGEILHTLWKFMGNHTFYLLFYLLFHWVAACSVFQFIFICYSGSNCPANILA